MGRAANGAVTYAPIGPQIEHGFEMGGSRIYPWDTGLAITPSSEYSDYIGAASGVPQSPPVGSLYDTTGSTSEAPNSAELEASAHPFGRTSPLPWVVLGLIGAVYAMHHIHYKD